MRRLARLANRLRTLFRRGHANTELQQEFQFHLDRQVAENIARGMSPVEARYAALRTFGNPALLRDQTRVTWVRALIRTPGFAIIAVLVMGLGIGANVALFTVVRGVLLRPLPFRNPDRLMMLYEHTDDGLFAYNGVSPGVFTEWQKQNHSFEQLAMIADEGFNLAGAAGQMPEKVRGGNCTWNLLTTLGVEPLLGRKFSGRPALCERYGTHGLEPLEAPLWRRPGNSESFNLSEWPALHGDWHSAPVVHVS
jgi:hypothetical protein